MPFLQSFGTFLLFTGRGGGDTDVPLEVAGEVALVRARDILMTTRRCASSGASMQGCRSGRVTL